MNWTKLEDSLPDMGVSILLAYEGQCAEGFYYHLTYVRCLFNTDKKYNPDYHEFYNVKTGGWEPIHNKNRFYWTYIEKPKRDIK